MEQIIKRAIEGGYKPTMYKGDLYSEDMVKVGFLGGYSITERDFFLDTLFWQALGKSCGWKQERAEFDMGTVMDGVCSCCTGFETTHIDGWKFHALRFHEINLTEGWDKAVKYLLSVTK